MPIVVQSRSRNRHKSGDQTPVTLDRLDVLHLATGLIWRDRIVNPHGVSRWPLGFAATRSRHGYVTVDRGE
jgi:hypothetical protein